MIQADCSFEDPCKETAEMGWCSHALSVEEENDLSFSILVKRGNQALTREVPQSATFEV